MKEPLPSRVEHHIAAHLSGDPEHYDLILNAATLTRNEQVAAVTSLFQKRFSLST